MYLTLTSCPSAVLSVRMYLKARSGHYFFTIGDVLYSLPSKMYFWPGSTRIVRVSFLPFISMVWAALLLKPL